MHQIDEDISSEESDDNPQYFNKRKNKKIQDFPINLTEIETMALFKERGLEVTEKDMQQALSKNDNQQKQKPTGYVGGAEYATFQELERDLEKAKKQDNPKQCSLVLTSMLDLELPQEKKEELALLKCEYMLKMKSYQDTINLCEKYIDPQHKTQPNQLFLRISKANAMAGQGQIWDGFMEIMRSRGLCQEILIQNLENNKKDQQNNDQLFEENKTQKLLKQIEESYISFFVKTQQKDNLNQENVTEYLYVTGNNKNCGLGDKIDYQILKDKGAQVIPELRNRQILSIACGDNHTISLVSGCSCSNIFDPKLDCKGLDTCNGGCEVLAWGSNSKGQINGCPDIGNTYSTPILISQLSGKQLIYVGAYGNSSYAITKQGQIYEWGEGLYNQNQNLQQIPLKFTNVNRIIRGKNCYIGHNKDNFKAYIIGSLKGPEKEGDKLLYIAKQQQELILPDNSNIIDIYVGDNHIIALNEEGKVYVMGDNSEGQCGFPIFQKQFLMFTLLESIQYYKITSISGFHNCSLFINDVGELLYTGKISRQKQICNPKEAEFREDVHVVRASAYYQEIHVLDSNGRSFVWDIDDSIKFKLNRKMQGQTFRYIANGQGFSLFMKTLPRTDLSTIKIDEEQEEITTYNPIKYNIQLRDDIGPYGLNPFVPLRFHIYLRKLGDNSEEILTDEQLTQESRKFTLQSVRRYNEPKLYCDELFTKVLDTYSMEQNQENLSIYNLQITVAEQGKYQFYVFMNEQIMNNCPISIDIQESQEEKDRKKKEEEERLLKEKENERLQNKQLQKKLKKEQLQQKKLEEEEQARLKKIETDLRAKEAYEKFLKEQEDKKIKDAIERSQKKSLLTGGGYDIDKIKQLQQNQNLDQINSTNKPLPALQRSPKMNQQKKLQILEEEKEQERQIQIKKQQYLSSQTGPQMLEQINNQQKKLSLSNNKSKNRKSLKENDNFANSVHQFIQEKNVKTFSNQQQHFRVLKSPNTNTQQQPQLNQEKLNNKQFRIKKQTKSNIIPVNVNKTNQHENQIDTDFADTQFNNINNFNQFNTSQQSFQSQNFQKSQINQHKFNTSGKSFHSMQNPQIKSNLQNLPSLQKMQNYQRPSSKQSHISNISQQSYQKEGLQFLAEQQQQIQNQQQQLQQNQFRKTGQSFQGSNLQKNNNQFINNQNIGQQLHQTQQTNRKSISQGRNNIKQTLQQQQQQQILQTNQGRSISNTNTNIQNGVVQQKSFGFIVNPKQQKYQNNKKKQKSNYPFKKQ